MFPSFCSFVMSVHVSRIQPLSDALGDLYKQFNSLKDELGKLTTKFDRVEAVVDDLQAGRITLPQRPIQRIPPREGLRPPLQEQMRAPERRISPGPTSVRLRGRRVPQRT